jgi:hypothetical protein
MKARSKFGLALGAVDNKHTDSEAARGKHLEGSTPQQPV